MKRVVSLLGAVFVVFLFMMPAAGMGAASKAVADGSFVQATLCGSWSDARWQEEFAAMKDAGMHYLVIGPVAECTSMLSPRGDVVNGVTKTFYPSTLPNTELDPSLNGHDMVDACLRNAESAGIKVFIGISSNSYWWRQHGSDTTWLYNQMNFDNQVCDEVWSLYKSKYPDAFYGWYWAYEVDNVSFATEAQQTELIHAMNLQLDHLTATDEKLPFMWCPFMNSALGTPQAYQSMWEYVLAGLHTTTGDIFCPQDGLGGGGTTLSNVVSWFSALRQAVDTKPGLVMWSDAETFVQSDWTSATLDRFISQLKLEQPYVDNYMTFAYCHYYSPYVTDPGFQATYIDYLNTGVLETTPPSAPPNFTAVSQAGDIILNWDESTDNIGVCGYCVYRNGTQIGKMQVSVSDGARAPLATSLTDNSACPNTNYTYEVKAYDFAGNFSGSSSASVTTGNFNVVSLGRPYKISVPPSSSYPDPNGTKLTDGTFASKVSYADPAWAGFQNFDTLNAVIDLGQTVSVQEFIGEYLLDPQPAVYLPKRVNVSISTDNVTFTESGTLNDSAQSDTLSSIHKYYYTLSNPANARYVKFTTISGGAWTFVDEYQVLNFTTTAIRQQASSVPSKFNLSNNYPNPFNPSTSISFTVAHDGWTTLKIYNILGQEIITVYGGNALARQDYSFNVSMNRFTSGVYFYALQQGSNVLTEKMILLK